MTLDLLKIRHWYKSMTLYSLPLIFSHIGIVLAAPKTERENKTNQNRSDDFGHLGKDEIKVVLFNFLKSIEYCIITCLSAKLGFLYFITIALCSLCCV